MVESVLVTILCCLPLGIVGIINASKVEGLYQAGNIEAAYKASAEAKKWSIWGAIAGGSVILIYVIFVVFAMIMGINA